MADEYKANQYQEQTSEAKIVSIRPLKHGDMPNSIEMQTRYDMRMSGGARPDVEGSPSKYMSTQFQVAVYRQVSRCEFRKVKLRAWTNMLLFYGDIIETGPYLSAMIEFNQGGIAVIKPSALIQILDREVQDLNYGNKDRLMKIIDKFIIDHNYDAPTIDFRSDDGTRDENKRIKRPKIELIGIKG